MGGSAASGGFRYQDRVFAYFAVHAIRRRPVADFREHGLPIRLACEVGGPGDDILVVLESGAEHEIQAKHGLDKTMLKTVLRNMEAVPGKEITVVCDPTSTAHIRSNLPRDLGRLRVGREDGLVSPLRELRREFSDSTLRRLYLMVLDVERDAGAHTVSAVEMLGRVLEDECEAPAAFSLLAEVGRDLSSDRSAMDRSALVQRLREKGIRLRPVTDEEKLHVEIDAARDLVRDGAYQAAIRALDVASEEARRLSCSAAAVRARILLGFCHLGLDNPSRALSCAQEAIDLDPGKAAAVSLEARALLESKSYDAAQQRAQFALRLDPNDIQAWCVVLRLADGVHVASEAPDEVRRSVDFRLTTADVLLESGQSSAALALTKEIMRAPDRPIAAEYLHTAALFSQYRNSAEKLPQIEERVSRLLVRLEPYDRLRPYALVLRAAVRERMGQASEAARDRDEALATSPARPALLHEATEGMSAPREVLRLLHGPLVEQDTLLLLRRSKAHLAVGNLSEASADYETAVAVVGERTGPGKLLELAEVALSLGRTDEALLHVARIPRDVGLNAQVEHIRAKAILHTGSEAEALAALEACLPDDSEEQQRMRISFALHAHLFGKNSAAGAALSTVDIGAVLPAARSAMGEVLLASRRYEDLEALLSQLSEEERSTTWALDLELQLAYATNHVQRAIGVLKQLMDRGVPEQARAHLHLAQLHASVGDEDSALRQLQLALEHAPGAAKECVFGARVALRLARFRDASLLAYRASRLAPGDPEVLRTALPIFVRCWPEDGPPPSVGADTIVRLRDESGVETSLTIYSDGVVTESSLEFREDDPRVRHLIGAGLGAQVPDSSPLGSGHRRIVGIKWAAPVYIHKLCDAFEQLFPDEPFLVRKFSALPGSVSGFSEMIRLMFANRCSLEEAIGVYRLHNVPLAVLANQFGQPIHVVMESLASGDSPDSAVLVEWLDSTPASSRLPLERARVAVLCASSLHTLVLLGLWELASSVVRFMSPLSLLQQTIGVLQSLRVMGLPDGRTKEVSDGLSRPPIVEGVNETHIRHLERSVACLKQVELVPRPTTRPAELREIESILDDEKILDEPSRDAVVLAVEQGAPLYADDLGLRRLCLASDRSFSSYGLLVFLTMEGVLDERVASEYAMQLVGRRYLYAPLSDGLVLSAMKGTGTNTLRAVRQCRQLLVRREGPPDESARRLARLAMMLRTSPPLDVIVDPEVFVREMLTEFCGVWETRWFPAFVAEVRRVAGFLLKRDQEWLERLAVEATKRFMVHHHGAVT